MQNNKPSKTKKCCPREILREHQSSVGDLRKMVRSRIHKINKAHENDAENSLPMDKFISSLTKLGEFFMKILKLEQNLYGINVANYEISNLSHDTMPQNDKEDSKLDLRDITIMHEFSEGAMENYEKIQGHSYAEMLNGGHKNNYLFH